MAPYRRRPTYKRKPKRATKGNSRAIVKTIRTVGRLAKMVNAERNFFDLNVSMTPTTTPVITPLELIPQGDDTQMREGRSIKLDGVYMRSHFYSAAAATTGCMVRYIIFRDNYQAGVAPVLGDILTGALIDAFRNINTANPGRYTILLDRIIKLSTAGSSPTMAVVNRRFNLHSHIRFLGTSASVANMGAGQIYLMYFADNNATNAVTGSAVFRTRYYDN